MPSFLEFFAGGGMARAGLGPAWRCLFANDFDPRKGLSYQANWGTGGELRVGDVARIQAADVPGTADLAWGSFPCQDLSLAGHGAGLAGGRSGTFYAFWDVIRDLAKEGRAPALVALENVCGTLTSHGGDDFRAICQTFAEAGYRHGALVINASLFVAQSRPRLFMVGVREDVAVGADLLAAGPQAPFHTPALLRAIQGLPASLRGDMLWWRLPAPPLRNRALADEIEAQPGGVDWHGPAETDRLLSLMAPLHLAKVEAARASGQRRVGCVYRRTRVEDGRRVQRAEVRFDGLSGCLRTPGGGSSRQMILVVEGEAVRSRLISPRETARLMGLDDAYVLPRGYGDALHLTGDGVVAPVVRHLARHILEPLLDGVGAQNRAA